MTLWDFRLGVEAKGEFTDIEPCLKSLFPSLDMPYLPRDTQAERMADARITFAVSPDTLSRLHKVDERKRESIRKVEAIRCTANLAP